jgi:hypothetical protein
VSGPVRVDVAEPDDIRVAANVAGAVAQDGHEGVGGSIAGGSR